MSCPFPYEVIYSRRKTVTLTVHEDGRITVRAPYRTSRRTVEELLAKQEAWLREHIRLQKEKAARFQGITEEDVLEYKRLAKEYFNDITAYYSKIMNLNYSRITITSAKKRFGSCNSKGNICFSWRLMLYPPEAREYVVVHELSHLVVMNHSPAFYRVVERYMPDYRERRLLLR